MKTLNQERFIKKLNRTEVEGIKGELKVQGGIMAFILTLFWGGYLLNNVILDGWISRNLVLQARSFEGLIGAFITPFMHLSVWHVLGSSILLLVLGWWVMLRDTRDFLLVHLTSLLGCGMLVWLFETSSTHWHGWGGIAFGMAGYLLTAGIFERRWTTILSSLVAMLFIGGWVLGTIFNPAAAGSWIGLMGGLFGGVLASAFLGWRRKKEPDPEDYLGSQLPSASDLVAGTTDVELDFEGLEASSFEAVETVSSAAD